MTTIRITRTDALPGTVLLFMRVGDLLLSQFDVRVPTSVQSPLNWSEDTPMRDVHEVLRPHYEIHVQSQDRR